ncbi:DUF397 domain-containing protein [Streptomyces sp. MST-110588]|uniref:DUF397 domain-containing protein n=1 Tax=Streptomyces sp. MST-110588 TaxID=2833628 RepID=UPI001F5CCBDE|nr:DUF397 domain-containing protein [Streptomyces sp. MST-110588]UNO40304.1 DUF397 domain-containing protein [Streptomyces sp. MST-110588]
MGRSEHNASDIPEVPIWRKSSYSGASGGNCLEFAAGHENVPVRDSKDPRGPVLLLSTSAWTEFVGWVAGGGTRGPEGPGTW